MWIKGISTRLLSAAAVMTVAALFSLSAAAAVILVPADHPTIQQAIDAASAGDTVLVSDGVWSGEGNRDLNLRGKAITVAAAGGIADCILAPEGSEAEPHRAFDLSRNEGRSAVIRGFTIRGGHVAGDFDEDDGGGIRLRGSSPTILDCIFFDNGSGGTGGGIACLEGSDALIEGCTFNDNSGFDGGGAVGCEASSPVIRDNLMIYNGVYRAGGAILCYRGSSPEITGNEIVESTAEFGGGIYCGYECSPLIEDNVISGNSSAFEGGGIHCNDGATPRIRNNLLRGNVSTLGGALAIADLANPLVEYCTFYGNQALVGGAIDIFEGAAVIKGCILWGNTADDGAALALRYGYRTAVAHLSYCDLQDGVFVQPGTTLNEGPGLISADPLFVRGPDGPCYLSQTAAGQGVDSPCLDASDPALSPPVGTTSTDRRPDLGVGDLGYHYEADWAAACDLDWSGRVDGGDLAILALAWGASTGEPHYDPRADIDGNGIVDGDDLALLASVFGESV